MNLVTGAVSDPELAELSVMRVNEWVQRHLWINICYVDAQMKQTHACMDRKGRIINT